jgi:hypothetical protein
MYLTLTGRLPASVRAAKWPVLDFLFCFIFSILFLKFRTLRQGFPNRLYLWLISANKESLWGGARRRRIRTDNELRTASCCDFIWIGGYTEVFPDVWTRLSSCQYELEGTDLVPGTIAAIRDKRTRHDQGKEFWICPTTLNIFFWDI